MSWQIVPQLVKRTDKETGEEREVPVNVKYIKSRPVYDSVGNLEKFQKLGLVVQNIVVQHSRGAELNIRHSMKNVRYDVEGTEVSVPQMIKLSVVYPEKRAYKNLSVGQGKNRRDVENVLGKEIIKPGLVEDFILRKKFVEFAINKFGFEVASQVFNLLDGKEV